MDFLDRLSQLPLFKDVPPAWLAEIDATMETNLFDGAHIVRQHEAPRFLYVILEGIVEIYAGPTPGAYVYIESRGRGDVIGEQAFIERKEHSADVVVRGDAKALKIPASLANKLLMVPEFSRNLLIALSAKLRDATEQRYKALAQRQLLFSHFRSYVNPQLVDDLLNRGEDYGSPRRIDPAFILFSDLREFTRLSSTMPELEVATQLAPYFSALVDIVHGTNGIVDKYIGDAVMAIWGHPALGSVDPDDVMEACMTMIDRSADLTFGGERIRLGIGLNVGPVFMGNIGNDEKRSFTVLGEAVNLAARYEAANKADDVVFALTVGPAMYELIGEKHKGALIARPHTPIKGVPRDAQTVYSFKGE